MIAPPILKDEHDNTSWTTVPPLGYGGIENVVYSLINGLIRHGCKIALIGSPGSNSLNGVTVIRDARGSDEIRSWIGKHYKEFDIIHDHSGGLVFDNQGQIPPSHYIATHHKTGKSSYPSNTVFLSYAQRNQAGNHHAPVIRLPIMFDNYLFTSQKDDYYLYMGRVSKFKGVNEAAAICEKLNAKLIVAGPNWEKEYFEKLIEKYPNTVEYIGEVCGLKKIDLLAKAKAVFVLSRFTSGLWGDEWCEPGATIVGESAASGTPVISSTNGCLFEIVVPNIGVQLEENEIQAIDISKLKILSQDPFEIVNYARNNWDHISISGQYIKLYERIINGFQW